MNKLGCILIQFWANLFLGACLAWNGNLKGRSVLFSSNFLALLSGLFSNLDAYFLFSHIIPFGLLELVLSRREMRLKIEFVEFSGIFSCLVWDSSGDLVVQHMDGFIGARRNTKNIRFNYLVEGVLFTYWVTVQKYRQLWFFLPQSKWLIAHNKSLQLHHKVSLVNILRFLWLDFIEQQCILFCKI